MDTIIINNQEFAKYDDSYYVSQSGDIYSRYSNKLLKHGIDLDGYHRVDIHQKHKKVHKLVWTAWMGEIPNGLQLNHKDDNKDNNSLSNLYLGTQKQNIADCVENGHRVGHTGYITVYDKKVKKTLTFSPLSEFIEYCGHSAKNGSVKKIFKRDWFNKRYKILDYNSGNKCND